MNLRCTVLQLKVCAVYVCVAKRPYDPAMANSFASANTGAVNTGRCAPSLKGAVALHLGGYL